jgi:hypothetical protein
MKEFLPFIDKRLEFRWEEKTGYGIYASDDIPKSIFVEIAPVKIIDPELMNLDENINIYVIGWGDKVALSFGWTMMYNHSDNNSCEFSCNIHDNLLAIITVRDIMKGEQLTVNYGPEWFSSRNIEKINI